MDLSSGTPSVPTPRSLLKVGPHSSPFTGSALCLGVPAALMLLKLIQLPSAELCAEYDPVVLRVPNIHSVNAYKWSMHTLG